MDAEGAILFVTLWILCLSASYFIEKYMQYLDAENYRALLKKQERVKAQHTVIKGGFNHADS